MRQGSSDTSRWVVDRRVCVIVSAGARGEELVRSVEEALPDCQVRVEFLASREPALARPSGECLVIAARGPDFAGLEFCAGLTSASAPPSGPMFLVLDHNVGPDVQERARRAGADAVIPWPSDRVAFGFDLRAALRRTRGAPASDADDERDGGVLFAQAATLDRLASAAVLSASVAHEANNALARLLFSLETLRDDISGRTRDALASATEIRELVRVLESVARWEVEDAALIPIERVIESAIRVGHSAIARGVRISKDFGHTTMVEASEGRLAHVFLELLTVVGRGDADREGDGREVRVRTWSAGEALLVEISGQTGVSGGERSGDGEQPARALRSVGVGSALGLAICDTILQGLGGTLQFDGVAGEESRFTVRLPAAREAGGRPGAGHDVAREGEDEGSPGRVLLVGVDASSAEALGQVLRPLQLSVASSLASAQENLAGGGGYDLVLVNVGGAGEPSARHLPAWLASGDAQDAERVACAVDAAVSPSARAALVSTGATVLSKPFEVSRLRELAASRVSTRRARAEGRPDG